MDEGSMTAALIAFGVGIAVLALCNGVIITVFTLAAHRDRRIENFKVVVAAEAQQLHQLEQQGGQGDPMRNIATVLPAMPREQKGWRRRRRLQWQRLRRRASTRMMWLLVKLTTYGGRGFEVAIENAAVCHFQMVLLTHNDTGTFAVVLLHITGPSKLAVINDQFTKRGHQPLAAIDGTDLTPSFLPMGARAYLFIEPALKRHRRTK